MSASAAMITVLALMGITLVIIVAVILLEHHRLKHLPEHCDHFYGTTRANCMFCGKPMNSEVDSTE